jgi:guanylate kinase
MNAEIMEPRIASQGKVAPAASPLLVLISAPSGGGKTTLCQQLLGARPQMTRAVTCTTRLPRKGERDGADYYFLDATSFLKRVQAGNFLEHATVYGNSYGILKAEVLGKLRQGKDVLLNVDVQGAATIREKAQEDPELKRALVSVFLTPALDGHRGGAPAQAGHGFGGGDTKAAECRAAGNRPVEEL